MNKFLIYGLCDPDTNEVRYVGRSSSGLSRPKSHSTNSILKKSKLPVHNWIRKLKSKNKVPLIYIFNSWTTIDNDQLNKEEIKTIKDCSTNNSIDLGSDAAEMKDIWAHSIKHNDVSNPNLNVSTIGNNGSLILTAHGTGSLDIKATKIRRTENGAGSNYFEDQYLDSLSLTEDVASLTEISSSLSYAASSYSGAIINYSMIEAVTGKTRIGQLIVSNTADGATVSSSDQFSETATLGAALGLQLDADFNSGNVRIMFKNTSEDDAVTMRAHIRKFRA